jgi:hypothetical protein
MPPLRATLLLSITRVKHTAAFSPYSRPVLGAGICGNPNVKYGGDDVWLGERHRQFVEGGSMRIKTQKFVGVPLLAAWSARHL